MLDKRTEWIESHARNMLGVWSQLEGPMQVDESFLAHIRQELEFCYDDPLRKALIEATYPAGQLTGSEDPHKRYGVAG